MVMSTFHCTTYEHNINLWLLWSLDLASSAMTIIWMNISNEIIQLYPSLLKIQAVQHWNTYISTDCKLTKRHYIVYNTEQTEKLCEWIGRPVITHMAYEFVRNIGETMYYKFWSILPHVIFQYTPRGHCSSSRVRKRWQDTHDGPNRRQLAGCLHG